MTRLIRELHSCLQQTFALAARFGGRKDLVATVMVTSVQAIFQVLAIAMFLPFFTLAMEPERAQDWPWIGEMPPSKALWAVGGVLLGLQLMASLFGLGGEAFRSYFGHSVLKNLSHTLVQTTIDRPYPDHFQINSGELLKKLREDTSAFHHFALGPVLELSARLLVIFLTLIFLVAMNWRVALGVSLLFGSIYLVLLLVFRGFLGRASNQRSELFRQQTTMVAEIIGNLKVILVQGGRRMFLDRYRILCEAFARREAPISLISNGPRYVLEFVIITSLVLVVFIASSKPENAAAVLPLAGTYGIAAMRMLPALNSIYGSFSSILSKRSVVADLQNELEMIVTPQDSTNSILPKPRFSESISFSGIGFTYPGKTTAAIADLNMDIPKGARIGIVGSSGAGKSTLIDLLLGLIQPDSGQILVDGRDLSKIDLDGWRNQIGYVPQEVFLFDASLAENIAFVFDRSGIDEDRLMRAAKAAQLSDFVESELPDSWETPIGERGIRLSGGQRQRIALARALYREPSVLLLDEATSALDQETERSVLQAIRQLPNDLTILTISHRASLLRESSEVYLIAAGHLIASGGFEQLLREEPFFGNLMDDKLS